MPKIRLLLTVLGIVLCPPAIAQTAPAPAKKLYCWNENGQRVCSDALSGDAVNRAREEISAKSGMRTAEIGRVMSEEERAMAASDEQQRQVDLAAAETRRRTEQAMLMSYQSEADLRRVFNERTSIVDNSIRTARYNVTSLREGLVSLLRTAGDRELDGKPVNPETGEEHSQPPSRAVAPASTAGQFRETARGSGRGDHRHHPTLPRIERHRCRRAIPSGWDRDGVRRIPHEEVRRYRPHCGNGRAWPGPAKGRP